MQAHRNKWLIANSNFLWCSSPYLMTELLRYTTGTSGDFTQPNKNILTAEFLLTITQLNNFTDLFGSIFFLVIIYGSLQRKI